VTRVALLTEIPAPYRIPLFNALAERVDLAVLYLRERNPERPYGLHADEVRFRHRVLPGLDVTVAGRWIVLNAGVSWALRGLDAVVLGGWNQPAFWEAMAWCGVRGVPTVAWVESTGRDRRTGRLEPVKRRMLRSIARFVVPGAASREYLHDLGIADERIDDAPNAVDARVITSGTRTRGDGPPRLLAVGRLAHEKGIDVLLRAADGLSVEIVLAGTGPQEAELREVAGPNTTFLGHVDRDALPALYADADVLVMPSRSDPWGMVLNEAALAGLPLVSTTAAGAAHELIEHGVNGFRVPPDAVDALREALRRLVDDGTYRQDAGVRSREIVALFTPEAWAEAVSAAVERAVGPSGRAVAGS
jgi:glycosyltransferase involved in cell wall biosynthesis